jgi:hypothetical protein
MGNCVVKYATYSSVTVSNSNVETDISNAANNKQSRTFNANQLADGDMLIVRAGGTFKSKAAPVGTLTLRLSFGGTSFAAVTWGAIPPNFGPMGWKYEAVISCEVSAGNLIAVAEAAAYPTTPFFNGVRDTLAPLFGNSNDLKLTAQWQTADANNSLTCDFVSYEWQVAV